MNNRPIISSHGISKYFHLGRNKTVVACEDINLDVGEREFVCMVGPSGCGKSTFLRIVAGLTQPDEGHLEIDKASRLSMIFQNAAVFPWLTVKDNIAFGLTMQGMNQAKIDKIVHSQIKNMCLDHAIHQHPKELSGGMKQRVGIARALAVDPDILLLDEPFSALDAFTAERLRKDVLSTWESEKRSILMVTHLVEEAVEMADRIVIMTKRPGRVKAIIEVDLPRPRNTRGREFFKYVDEVRDLVIPEHTS